MAVSKKETAIAVLIKVPENIGFSLKICRTGWYNKAL